MHNGRKPNSLSQGAQVTRRDPNSCRTDSSLVVFHDLHWRHLHISVVVKRHAVKLFERVRNLPVRCGQSWIHGDAFHLRRCRGAANVHTATLLDIAEVAGVNTASLVRDHRRLHVADECPLGLTEKRMSLDIRCSSSSSKAFCFVFDQKLADQRLAETARKVLVSVYLQKSLA